MLFAILEAIRPLPHLSAILFAIHLLGINFCQRVNEFLQHASTTPITWILRHKIGDLISTSRLALEQK
jgi:hypothetical protein